MIDPNNREVLTRVYRLVEKYETPPKNQFADDATNYFVGILKDIKSVIDEFPQNGFAWYLCLGLYDALDERFKAVNKLPLMEREPEPEQQRLF